MNIDDMILLNFDPNIHMVKPKSDDPKNSVITLSIQIPEKDW
jgi:hypothetical protein